MLPVNVRNGKTSSAEQVAFAELDRIDTELETRLVDDAFEQCGRLGSSGAAVRADGRRVGHRDRNVELDRREVIRAVRHATGAAGEIRADGGVGPGIADKPDAQAGEGAIALAAELYILDLAGRPARRRPRSRRPSRSWTWQPGARWRRTARFRPARRR